MKGRILGPAAQRLEDKYAASQKLAKEKHSQTYNKTHVYNDNDTDEYHDWKNSIYAKFQCTCQKCKGGKETHLTVHHIYNYYDNPGRIMDPTNGTLLCQHCHDLYHLQYGGRYNTRKQLMNFLKH